MLLESNAAKAISQGQVEEHVWQNPITAAFFRQKKEPLMFEKRITMLSS